jgi:hypothetical protein
MNEARKQKPISAVGGAPRLQPSRFTPDDNELMLQLEKLACKLSDGHVTIMRFTTNWRVGLFTPNDCWMETAVMAEGPTFADAARAVIADAEKFQNPREYGTVMLARKDDAKRAFWEDLNARP